MSNCRGSNVIYQNNEVDYMPSTRYPGGYSIQCPYCGRTVNCHRTGGTSYVTNRHKPELKPRNRKARP